MMNQYYGFTGRNGRMGSERNRDDRSRSPYRRPMGHTNMYPYGSSPPSPANGGCGCGMNRTDRRSCSHTHGQDRSYEHSRTVSVSQQSEGCGCNNRDRNACNRLLEQIRAVDFALYETVLYLDVYPDSCDALETYHKLKEQSKALHDEYETSCGPLTAFGNHSAGTWDWMSKPFPWEYDAN